MNPYANNFQSQAIYPDWVITMTGGTASQVDAAVREGISKAFDQRLTMLMQRSGLQKSPQQLADEIYTKARKHIVGSSLELKVRCPDAALQIARDAVLSSIFTFLSNGGVNQQNAYNFANAFDVNLKESHDRVTALLMSDPFARLNSQGSAAIYQGQPSVMGAGVNDYASSLYGSAPQPQPQTGIIDPDDVVFDELAAVHYYDKVLADGTTQRMSRSMTAHRELCADVEKLGAMPTEENIQKLIESRLSGGTFSTTTASVTPAIQPANVPVVLPLDDNEKFVKDFDVNYLYDKTEFDVMVKNFNRYIALKTANVNGDPALEDEASLVTDLARSKYAKAKELYDEAMSTGRELYFTALCIPTPVTTENAELYISQRGSTVGFQNTVKEKPPVLPKTYSTPEHSVGEYADTPTAGVPSVGLMNTVSGKPVNMEDYGVPASYEQRQAAMTSTDTAYDSSEDEFINDILNEVPTDEEPPLPEFGTIPHLGDENVAVEMGFAPVDAAVMETLKTDSYDEIMAKAEDAGHEIAEPTLEQVWNDVPKEVRMEILRLHRVIVPAYLKGVEQLIMIRVGDKVTIEVREMDREKHVIRNNVVHWDKDATDLAVGREKLSSWDNAQPLPIDEFVERINQNINDTDLNVEDIVLSHTLSKSPVVEVEEIIIVPVGTTEYQQPVVDELANRKVSTAQITNILENGVIKISCVESDRADLSVADSDLFVSAYESQNAPSVISAVNELRSNTTLPIREISRIVKDFGKVLNQQLSIHLGPCWTIDDFSGDFDEYTAKVVLGLGATMDDDDILALIDKAYVSASRICFNVIETSSAESESESSYVYGKAYNAILLPIYYTQYPLAATDCGALLDRKTHPELVSVLDTYDGSAYSVTKLITLDNVTLTYVTDDGEHYLVNVAE